MFADGTWGTHKSLVVLYRVSAAYFNSCINAYTQGSFSWGGEGENVANRKVASNEKSYLIFL